MSKEELYHGIVNIVDGAISLLAQHATPEYVKSVRIDWNPRMRSTAGRAFLREAKVELNPKLLNISLEQVNRTLLHELAHLLTYHRYGERRLAPHGKEWQQACADLGIPDETATHDLPLPSHRQKKKWRYICPHCNEAIDRVHRMKSISACYPCCKKHNRGKYTKKFQLVEYQLEEG